VCGSLADQIHVIEQVEKVDTGNDWHTAIAGVSSSTTGRTIRRCAAVGPVAGRVYRPFLRREWQLKGGVDRSGEFSVSSTAAFL